jgi:hypothetical protein
MAVLRSTDDKSAIVANETVSIFVKMISITAYLKVAFICSEVFSTPLYLNIRLLSFKLYSRTLESLLEIKIFSSPGGIPGITSIPVILGPFFEEEFRLLLVSLVTEI